MSQRRPIRFLILSLGAAFMLPSCSSAGNLGGMPAVGSNAQSRHAAQRSWIKPGIRVQKLLYVADSGSGTVQIYTYPRLSYAGELTGFSQPLFDCADKAGNVWVVDYGTDGVGAAYEYAHGGTTPINEISGLPYPYACAVNRTNGDLAIAINLETESAHLGEVAIYHNGSSNPSVYDDRHFTLDSGLAYDNAGNLFVDGYAAGDAFHYAELPAGSSTFTDITLGTTPDAPGAVVWDGQYIDVADNSQTIYQTQGATVVNSLSLNLSNDTLRGYYVSGKNVIATDLLANFVGVFRYPAGGSTKKSITSGLNMPWDVVLSK